MAKPIKIYGQLERIFEEIEPERNKQLYAVGTLKKAKLSPEEILGVINESKWNIYSKEKAEEIVQDFFEIKKDFFSSSKSSHEEKHEEKKSKEWQFGKGWIRTQESNEVYLDIDSKEKFEEGIEKCKRFGLKGYAVNWYGARGGHISLPFDGFIPKKYQGCIRVNFNGDSGCVNASVVGKPHHKTGYVVKIVWENKGLNKLENLKGIVYDLATK